MSDIFDKKDEFWDIAKLMPAGKQKSTSQEKKYPEIKTVEYKTGGKDAPSGECKLNFSTDASLAGSEYTYIPKNRFIESVSIISAPDKFDFYGYFRKAAEVYYDFKMSKCDFVPFYSYMPQYSQFTSEQKAFYFYWRDEVRHKRYIRTDYSYIYLYAYEILNLSDRIGVTESLDILVDIWRAYRTDYPKIDDRFIAWVRDFCLVNKLEAPTDRIGDFIFDILGKSELCEFYINGFDSSSGVPARVITSYLSNYDWREGKYAGGEWAEIYKALMEGAMELFISKLWSEGRIGMHSGALAVYEGTAFLNSLCTHKLKKKIKVSYYPISNSKELRETVTAAVRYTENKLRAILGIKSRLAVKGLSDSYKAPIDLYFKKIIERKALESRAASAPEYEKLYDAPSSDISIGDAEHIEKTSWSTTARLVSEEESEGFEKNEIQLPSEKNKDESAAPPKVNDIVSDELSYGLSDTDINAIKSLMSGAPLKDGAVAERINEAFSDGFGDVILESDGDYYHIIEDYTEDVSEWLERLQKN